MRRNVKINNSEKIDLNFHIKIKFKSKKQKELSELIKKNRITFVTGSPGTGKTIISLKTALELLKDEKSNIGNIILSTPIVSVDSVSIGYLPGDEKSKTALYFEHFYENLNKIIDKDVTTFLRTSKLIEEKIINFVRGTTFGKYDDMGNPIGSLCLLDECFVGKTQITTEFINSDNRYERYSYISKICERFKKGEEIWIPSYNTITNKIENKKIINVFKNLDKNIVDVFLELKKHPIRTTNNHPFPILEGGEIVWKSVKNLQYGDNILRYKKENSNNSNIMFSDSYDILLGFMLGDGSILKTKQKKLSYRLSKNHGLKQREYMIFCKNIFKNSRIHKNIKSGYTNKPLCGFQTKSMILDHNFINSVRNDKSKHIIQNIEKYFTLRTLALWYMDDGYYHKSKYIVFNTQGFDSNEIDVLCDILRNKYNFSLGVDIVDSRKNDGKKYRLIRLHKESSKKMLEMIKDLLHPSMLYKSDYVENNFDDKEYEIKTSENLTTSIFNYTKSSGTEDTYNLEIEGNNNYFIGKYLVHNCQNTTPLQLRTYVSRLGENSKMVILGDLDQTDIHFRNGEKSGLHDAINRFEDFDNIGIFNFTEDDIVRDPFLIEIMKRYKEKVEKQ